MPRQSLTFCTSRQHPHPFTDWISLLGCVKGTPDTTCEISNSGPNSSSQSLYPVTQPDSLPTVPISVINTIIYLDIIANLGFTFSFPLVSPTTFPSSPNSTSFYLLQTSSIFSPLSGFTIYSLTQHTIISCWDILINSQLVFPSSFPCPPPVLPDSYQSDLYKTKN